MCLIYKYIKSLHKRFLHELACNCVGPQEPLLTTNRISWIWKKEEREPNFSVRGNRNEEEGRVRFAWKITEKNF